MCGIAGYFGKSRPGATDLVSAMAAKITHRGPDDSGSWSDDECGIALAHRRLSILDRSPAGHQPMVSRSGRYIISFNGEIYNHLELRRRIEFQQSSYSWNGHSDTETLLTGFEAWGIRAVLGQAVGMFAFAVWDRARQVLTLARDRIGEKPLYYGICAGTFLFASELKPLTVHPDFSHEIDPDALALFLRYAYVPAPRSIYRAIAKLPPGTFVEIDSTSVGTPVVYWSLSEVAALGRQDLFVGTDAQACTELDRLLRQSIRGQMIADVPLGAFLSGGIDSTTVVALMQAESGRPVRTYTIGFDDALFDEAAYAGAVARHLGCDHRELYVGPEMARNVIPNLQQIYDEPFADSSQIPTYLVSALARQNVTVSLSGDGADELFGGYSRYLFVADFWGKLKWLPKPLRFSLAGLLQLFPSRVWNQILAPFEYLLPRGRSIVNPGAKLHKLADFVTVDSAAALYGKLISFWDNSAALVNNADPGQSSFPMLMESPHVTSVESMMNMDMATYLPDDILVKVDRAAMAVSLETRVPFLDHRVVEFAARLPLHMKIRRGQGKWLLRQVLYQYVPKHLMERPKMGFSVPLDTWLRGPLREWAHDLLSEASINKDGYLDPMPIRRRWQEHLSGERNWQFALWNVLMFQAWLRNRVLS